MSLSTGVQGMSTHAALQVSRRKHLSKQLGLGGSNAFGTGTERNRKVPSAAGPVVWRPELSQGRTPGVSSCHLSEIFPTAGLLPFHRRCQLMQPCCKEEWSSGWPSQMRAGHGIAAAITGQLSLQRALESTTQLFLHVSCFPHGVTLWVSPPDPVCSSLSGSGVRNSTTRKYCSAPCPVPWAQTRRPHCWVCGVVFLC